MEGDCLTPGLTERQRRFVTEYLEDRNAAAAAVRAGYSPNRAATMGHRLKTLPKIRAAIEAERVKRSRRGQAGRDRALEELSRIAFADIADFLHWDETGVTLRPMDELTRDQTACVAEVVETSGKTGKLVRVKLHGKLPALAALLKEAGAEAPLDTNRPRQLVVLTHAPEPAPLPAELAMEDGAADDGAEGETAVDGVADGETGRGSAPDPARGGSASPGPHRPGG